MSFELKSDPGHGWLIVTLAELVDVGLTESDITPYSYRLGEIIGLEEDCDAGTFIDAYQAKYGSIPAIIERDGSCRSWSRFGTKELRF